MKTVFSSLIVLLFLLLLPGAGCTGNSSQTSEAIEPSIIGTWQLLTVLTIEGEDSVLTDYTNDVKGIKMLNDTHFAFFQHDLNQGKDSTVMYVSGGGPYTYVDSIYTEHLEYCNFRVYENNIFEFEVTISGDTLIQKGEEEVPEAGINKYILETYVRID